MEEIKELLVAIQIVAGVGGMFRVVYLIGVGRLEEDFTPYRKKIIKVLIAVVLIETGLFLPAIIKGYYYE